MVKVAIDGECVYHSCTVNKCKRKIAVAGHLMSKLVLQHGD